MRILVTGAGGFIGGHLAKRLFDEGEDVVCVDVKPFKEWYHQLPNDHVRDLSRYEECLEMVDGVDQVYNLAADMGGMGFIETHKAACMESVLISTHMLKAAQIMGVKRFFYSSSACVYAADKQMHPDVTALKEEDAYPAMPEDGYGWEKLFTERMCRHYAEDYGFDTRVARYHNVYGPLGTYRGGREKAPAAICRKVIEAKLKGKKSIEIWGDGTQTRSFMYIDDCIEGTRRIMDSDIDYPINLGSNELVTINQLMDIVEDLAGTKFRRRYNRKAPQGVRGRNSDNTRLKAELDWEPSTPLKEGMKSLYEWIFDEVTR